MRFPAGLRALNHRDFLLFWSGQVVSLCGTWMQSLGQSWLVLTLTNSPFLLGLINVLQFGPFLLLSFFTGVVADRFPKRALVLATQTALTIQAAILAALVLWGHIRYWQIAALAAFAGVVNTLDMPTRQSFIVEMAGRSDLMNAIALNSAAFNTARVIGPALAGLVIARFGVGMAFAANAISFLAVIAALVAIASGRERRPRRPASMFEEMIEGVDYAMRAVRIRLVLVVLLIVGLFVFNYNVVVPLLARDVLHQQASGFGILMAALGVGALVGAIGMAALVPDRPPIGLILVSAAAVSAATLAMGFVHHFWIAAALLLVMGATGLVFMTSCNTTLQLSVPDALRGRVMSLYTLVFAGTTPLGSFLVGVIAEHAGVLLAFLVTGALSLAAVLVIALWWRGNRRRPPSIEGWEVIAPRGE